MESLAAPVKLRHCSGLMSAEKKQQERPVGHSSIKEKEQPVLRWHKFLCIVSMANIFTWLVILKSNRYDGVQLALSLFYVLGCAYRSFYPRADLQRIVIVDSPLSRVFYGRSVATLAELAYAAQLAIYFDMALLVPLLCVAEVFSWYAIITNRPLFNMFENSLWTISAAAIVVSCDDLVFMCLGSLFVLFMVTVDLPMYLRRENPATKRRPFAEGIKLLLTDYTVTLHIDDWREEMAWMAGYFSFAVWSSLYFALV